MSVAFSLLLMVPKYLSGGALAAESYLMLAVWAVLGFAVYRLVFKRHRERFGRTMAVWIGMMALVFFSSLMWVRQTSTRTIRNEVDRVSAFYVSQFRKLTGTDPSEEGEAQAHAFLDGSMEHLEGRLLLIDLVQLSLPVFAILLTFSLYRTQQQREKSLELAKTRAEANNRAKTGFLSNISHDIRTPLNAIIGYTELAEDDSADADAFRGYIAKIRDSGHSTKPYRRQMLLDRIAGMLAGAPTGTYTPLVRGRAPRILFTDDAKLNHTVMTMHFRKLGLDDCTSAMSAPEALEKLRNPGPRPFDLLITDLQMPGMTGRDLVQAIRSDPTLCKLPVFVFTADDELAHTYATHGFTGALIKPATVETIKAMLDSITAKST